MKKQTIHKIMNVLISIMIATIVGTGWPIKDQSGEIAIFALLLTYIALMLEDIWKEVCHEKH